MHQGKSLLVTVKKFTCYKWIVYILQINKLLLQINELVLQVNKLVLQIKNLLFAKKICLGQINNLCGSCKKFTSYN